MSGQEKAKHDEIDNCSRRSMHDGRRAGFSAGAYTADGKIRYKKQWQNEEGRHTQEPFNEEAQEVKERPMLSKIVVAATAICFILAVPTAYAQGGGGGTATSKKAGTPAAKTTKHRKPKPAGSAAGGK